MASRRSRCLGQRASFKMLIVGEIGAGKTRLTKMLVETLASLGLSKEITVIDMAPAYKGVGLPLEVSGVRVLRPEKLYAPRLMGRSCDEVWRYARLNETLTRPLLEKYLRDPTPILVINDLTIYLHAGDPSLLYRAVDTATLFIGNAYYGTRLRDECGLWEREKRLVEDLMARVDMVCRL